MRAYLKMTLIKNEGITIDQSFQSLDIKGLVNQRVRLLKWAYFNRFGIFWPNKFGCCLCSKVDCPGKNGSLLQKIAF